MEKIKNIEFLRIIGCLAIVVLHFFNKNHINADFFTIPLYSKMYILSSNGDKAVDLFFILSGLFFALKLDLKESFGSFFVKKIIKFYPVLIFLMTVALVFRIFGILKWDLYSNLILLLGLNGTSLSIDVSFVTHLSQFWYVSAILWIFALYLYLLKNYSKKTVDLIIAVITFFAYSFIIHAKGGRISGTDHTFYYIFNTGMLRAYGGIGIGYFIAQWWRIYSEKIKLLSLSVSQKIVVSIIEFACIYFIIENLMFHKLSYKNQLIFIIIFTLTILLFLIKKCVVSKFLDKNIFVNLSKYTFSIYMVHNLVYHVLRGSIWLKYPQLVFEYPVLNFCFTVLIVLIFAIIIYHLVEKPCINYCRNKYIKERFQND